MVDVVVVIMRHTVHYTRSLNVPLVFQITSAVRCRIFYLQKKKRTLRNSDIRVFPPENCYIFTSFCSQCSSTWRIGSVWRFTGAHTYSTNYLFGRRAFHALTCFNEYWHKCQISLMHHNPTDIFLVLSPHISWTRARFQLQTRGSFCRPSCCPSCICYSSYLWTQKFHRDTRISHPLTRNFVFTVMNISFLLRTGVSRLDLKISEHFKVCLLRTVHAYN